MENRRREEKELINGVKYLGLELIQEEIGLLLRYAELVKEWNQRINLVSRKDIGNLVVGHIVDSLAGVPVLKKLMSLDSGGKAVSLERQARGLAWDDTAPTHPTLSDGVPARQNTSHPRPFKVMDLGSGGGLPGIPLKICLPEIDLTLVESTKKKARFLETTLRELGLDGVSVVDRYSRELEKDPVHKGRYEVVTARAVAELKDLVVLAFPFLRHGGCLVAYKGARSGEEIASAKAILKRMGGTIEEEMVGMLPDSGNMKKTVVVRKTGSLR